MSTKNYIVSSVEELRYALDQKGTRKITFGHFERHPEFITELGYVLYVEDHQDLFLENGDVEIDGSESKLPVMIYGARLHIKNATNVVLRNIQLRLGAYGWKSNGKKTKGKDRVERESLLIERSKNVLVSHCSISWGTDETVAVIDSRYVTLEWTMISEPLNEPRDSKGELIHSNAHEHGYGCLIRGSKKVLMHHCLLAHCLRRSPSISPDGKYQSVVQVANCLIYDYREHGSCFNEGDADQNFKGKVFYNLIGNCYQPRKKSTGHGPDISLEEPLKEKMCFYQEGNYRKETDGKVVKADIVIDTKQQNKGKIVEKDKYKLKLSDEKWEATELAVEKILKNVGVVKPKRNLIDLRIIDQVIQRTGDLIDHEKDTPEFGLLKKVINL